MFILIKRLFLFLDLIQLLIYAVNLKMVLNEIINEEYELIFERVLSFLDPASVAILGSCNKKFRNLVNSSLIWFVFKIKYLKK